MQRIHEQTVSLRAYIRHIIYENRTHGLSPELIKAIRQHLVNNLPLRGKYVNELKALLTSKSLPAIVHEPPQRAVFRGMTVTSTWLTRTLGSKTNNKNGKRSIEFSVGKENVASSWTTSLERARSYFYIDDRPNLKNVIMTALVADNPDTFVACAGGLYKIDELSTMRKDRETISLGPVVTHEISWFDHND